MVVYHLVDEVAEHYLDLIDALNDEIDELEDHVEDWPAERIRARLSEFRHDLLHIRRTLAPTRDAIRSVVDGRIDLDGEEVFTHDVEVNFAGAYDKLLRATDGLELSRDLIAGVRDYHQAKIANDQNDVTKRLTAIASILLLRRSSSGYTARIFGTSRSSTGASATGSWSWIAVTTAFQIVYFRRKGWL